MTVQQEGEVCGEGGVVYIVNTVHVNIASRIFCSLVDKSCEQK